MIDLSRFNWNAGEGIWIRPSPPGPQPEVVIAGDEQGPEPSCLPIAEAVLTDIDGVIKHAAKHLDTFVDRTRFARDSEWYLDAVEFGCRVDQPKDEFVAYFSLEEDTYGLWSVLLRRTDHAGIVIVSFSRRQQ
jgi:hypothetical protein